MVKRTHERRTGNKAGILVFDLLLAWATLNVLVLQPLYSWAHRVATTEWPAVANLILFVVALSVWLGVALILKYFALLIDEALMVSKKESSLQYLQKIATWAVTVSLTMIAYLLPLWAVNVALVPWDGGTYPIPVSFALTGLIPMAGLIALAAGTAISLRLLKVRVRRSRSAESETGEHN